MKKLTSPLTFLFIISFLGACSPDSMLGPEQEYAYLNGDGTNQGIGGDGTNQGIGGDGTNQGIGGDGTNQGVRHND